MHRILIIEDQADIRRLIRWALEEVACEIQEAAHGTAGLAAVATFRPDLILLDVMMPGGIDGLEVCRRVKAAGDDAPVVLLLTARAQDSDRRAAEAAGADRMLAKPFSPHELVDTIRQLLQGRAAGSTPRA